MLRVGPDVELIATHPSSDLALPPIVGSHLQTYQEISFHSADAKKVFLGYTGKSDTTLNADYVFEYGLFEKDIADLFGLDKLSTKGTVWNIAVSNPNLFADLPTVNDGTLSFEVLGKPDYFDSAEIKLTQGNLEAAQTYRLRVVVNNEDDATTGTTVEARSSLDEYDNYGEEITSFASYESFSGSYSYDSSSGSASGGSGSYSGSGSYGSGSDYGSGSYGSGSSSGSTSGSSSGSSSSSGSGSGSSVSLKLSVFSGKGSAHEPHLIYANSGSSGSGSGTASNPRTAEINVARENWWGGWVSMTLSGTALPLLDYSLSTELTGYSVTISGTTASVYIPAGSGNFTIFVTAISDGVEPGSTVGLNSEIESEPLNVTLQPIAGVSVSGPGVVTIEDILEGVILTASPNETSELGGPPVVYHVKPANSSYTLNTAVQWDVKTYVQDATLPNGKALLGADYSLSDEYPYPMTFTDFDVSNTPTIIRRSNSRYVYGDADFQLSLSAIDDKILEGKETVEVRVYVPAIGYTSSFVTSTITESYNSPQTETTETAGCNYVCVTCSAGVAVTPNLSDGAASLYPADGELVQVTSTQWGATSVLQVGVKIPSGKAVPETITAQVQAVDSYVDGSGTGIGLGRKPSTNSLVSGVYTWQVPPGTTAGETLWFSIFADFSQHLNSWSRGGTLQPGSSGISARVVNYEVIVHPTYNSSVVYTNKISGWVGADSATIMDPGVSSIMPGFAPGLGIPGTAQLIPDVTVLQPDPTAPTDSVGRVQRYSGKMLVLADGTSYFFKQGETTSPGVQYVLSGNTLTDRYGNKMVFNASGDLIQTISPEGNITAYTYYADGGIQSKTDSRGQVTQYTRSVDGAGNQKLTISVVNGLLANNRVYDAVWKATSGVLEITYVDPDGAGPRQARQEKLQYSSGRLVSISSGTADTGMATTSFGFTSGAGTDGGISTITYPDGSSLTVELSRRRNGLPGVTFVSPTAQGALRRSLGTANPVPEYAISTYKRSPSSTPQRTISKLDHRGRVLRSWDPEQVNMMGLGGTVTWNDAAFATLQANLDRSTEYVRQATTRDAFGRVTGNDWGEVLSIITPDPDRTATTNGPRTRQTTTLTYTNNNPVSVTNPLVPTTSYTWNDTFDTMTSYTDELGNKVYQTVNATTGLVTQRRWEQQASNAPWQNPLLTPDVNGDGFVSSIDVLQVITFINTYGEGPASGASAPPPYLDVDGNGYINDADREIIVNYLNAVSAGQTPYAPPVANSAAQTIQQIDYTYVNITGLPKGLVSTETVQTGRASGTRVTTYQYINTPADKARHAKVSTITETGTGTNAITTFTYDNRGNVASVTDPAGRVQKYWYDNRDRLIATLTSDPDGSGSLLPVLTRYDYDGNDNLIATELINSRMEGSKLLVTALITSYTFDAMGRQTSTITQRPNLEWFLTYSGSTIGMTSTKPTTSSTITQAVLETYALANSRITNTPAANSSYRGLVSQISYFSTANTITETISNNASDARVWKTEFDLLGRPVKSVTPAPVTGYTTKTNQQLESGGIVSRVEYDNLGNVVSMRDGLNNLTKVTYDNLNRITSVGTPHPTTSGVTLDTLIGYHPTKRGWITTSTDPAGNTVAIESDMLGRTVRASGNSVPMQSISYWTDGLLKSTTDANQSTTDYQYDRRGRLTSVTAPAPSTGATRPAASWTYTVDNLISSATDPLGRITTYQYDAGGRGLSVTAPDPDGAGSLVSAYSKVVRDSLGNVMAATDAVNDPLNHWTYYTYDSWFRPTTSTDPLGAVTTTNYDVFGNVTGVIDPLSNSTTYTYNKLDQLITENKGTSRSFSYDANGNLATLTDRNSRVTTYTYDNRNRLTNESWAGTRTIGYVYDTVDRITAINDSDPLAIDFTYAYDTRSQLKAELQSGSSYLLGKNFALDRDFDKVGNQTKLGLTIGGTLSGTTITGGIADFVNTYKLDNLGRQISVTQTKGATGNTVAPKHVTTAYNLASQVTDVRRYSATTNTAANLEVHTRNAFDAAGRLKSITHSKAELAANVNWNGTSTLPSAGTVAAYFFNYDADNRITRMASRSDGFVTNYSYDITDQLTAATSTAIAGLTMPFTPTAESYNLDANGNRKSSAGASQSAAGTHNRLQTDGTYNYTYDNEGNTTRRTKISDNTVTDYTWDYRNRLATVTDKVSASGATLKKVEYTYDTFDQRTAKRVDNDGNGTWDRYEVFVWADGQEVQRWVDTDGAVATQKLRLTNRYLWADAVDQLLADEQYAAGAGMLIDAAALHTTAGNTLWALTDHLGSVRDLIDNNGVIREHNVYDSFGRLIREVDYNASGTVIANNDAAAVDTIFGYTGRDFDSDTGLQYNRARWYDPQTGRWLSQDPIGFAAGDANLYRYVGNGPTNFVDPSGLHKGHHIVVVQVRRLVPQAAFDVFDSLDARITNDAYRSHNYGKFNGIKHCDYNTEVIKEFEKFVKDNKINPKKMTADQAKDFVNHLKNLPARSLIKKFNKGVQAAADAAELAAKAAAKSAKIVKTAKGGGKLAKAIPGVGIFFAVAGWGVDGYCKGPVYGTVNSGIDAIPFVGGGKILIELTITGDWIPDAEAAEEPEMEEPSYPEHDKWMEEFGGQFPDE